MTNFQGGDHHREGRRFFIPPERHSLPEPFLDGEEARHLIKVLRLGAGDVIVLFDGTGWEFQARITKIRERKIFFSVSEKKWVPRESPLEITLGVPLIRPQALEWILQKGTELGTAAFHLYYSSFSAQRYDKSDMRGRLPRWQRIITEAAKQCGRNRLPDLVEPVPLERLLEGDFGQRIVPYENENAYTFREIADKVPRAGKILTCIGPEGGFAPKEIRLVRQKKGLIVSLGPRILRSETAALAVLTLMQFLWGDVGKKKEGVDDALS